MHAWRTILVAGWLALGPGLNTAGAAQVQVEVRLVDPASFADAGYHRRLASEAELQQLRQALQATLQPLAERSLQAGDRLTLEVLDLDLAGELQPTRQGSELRVMRGVTWPRMQLRHVLLRDGVVLSQGEQRVSDLDYLDHPRLRNDGTRYLHEQALLRDWFERTLAPAAAPR